MFMTSSSLILFSLSIFSSILLVLSSPSIFIAWLGLELNALTFIPFLLKEQSLKSGECAIKYFLSQTLGSILILVSLLYPFSSTSSFLLIAALVLKLGGAPFHSWFPSVSANLNWFSLFFLFTIQKINPLVTLILFTNYSMLLLLFSTLSLLVGAILGLVQTQTRKLFAYSSISQVGWMLASTSLSSYTTILFFIFYCFTIYPVLFLLHSLNFNLLKQMLIKNNKQTNFVLFLMMLSLGGLPPFLGFLPKWLVLNTMIYSYPLISTIMIMMSLITLYFYLRITISSFTFSFLSFNNMSTTKISNKLIVFTLVTIFSLPLSFLI